MPGDPKQPFTFNYIAKPWNLPASASNEAYLVGNNWDDFDYQTTHTLFLYDSSGTKHELGYVKIAQFKEGKICETTVVPKSFPRLDENYFSLGQTDTYYDKLNALGDEIRDKVLLGLNDIALNRELWTKVKDLEITKKSLLRGIQSETVEIQFHRIARGGVRLTDYHFTYALPEEPNRSEISLDFDVLPDVFPPTNVHVLIGQNGAGKTHILNCMTKALVNGDSKEVGVFEQENSEGRSRPFANLVSVAFSAFDPFLALEEGQDTPSGIRYSYIGLKTSDVGENYGAPKTLEALTAEFVASLDSCYKTLRIERWRRTVKILEVDRNFRDMGFSAIASNGETEIPKTQMAELFRSLSSGHKIVLLTITRLVEEVEDRTLILLDEPEAHLHPPLLSAFVRSLSELLIDRNGVVIIATHSPVVLQEVPKNCVWKIRRSGREVQISRPEINETFGENVGVLTREVFKLEVEQSGFHKMLSDAADREDSFDAAVKYFNDALGAEARAMLRAMYAEKKPKSLEN